MTQSPALGDAVVVTESGAGPYTERKGWPLRHVTAGHCPVHRMLNSEVRITTTGN